VTVAIRVGDLSGRPLVGTQLDQDLFVDREPELRVVAQSVRRRSNVLVLGRRGSGKTSFLHRVALELDRGERQPVLVDASPAETLGEVVELVRSRLRRHVSLGRAAQDRSEPVGLFAQIQSLRPRTEPDREIAILLDDLGSSELAHTLFGRLRDELWKLPYVWVVADDEANRLGYLRRPADAFFGTVVELGEFPLEQSVELLKRRTGRELTDRLLSRIARETGGNPRMLLTLARDVLLSESEPEQVLDERSNRRLAVAELGVPAGRVIEYIEDVGPVSASDQEFLDRLGWTRNRATQVLNELEREGVLFSHVEKGGRKKLFALAG
jgi:energy-coupling factor transporter ATP-binding protein EcfA2